MVAIANNISIIDHLVKNKDVRSTSIDSFSSTVDARRDDSQCFCHSKEPISPDHAPGQFILVQAERGYRRDNGENNAQDDLDSASRSFEFVEILPPEDEKHHSRNAETDTQLLDLFMRKRAFSSIVVLSSATCPRARDLLDAHDGHLIDVGPRILEGLRDAAPSRLAARVGDYNGNLFYEMQAANRDIASIIVEDHRRRRMRRGDGGHDDDEGIALQESSIRRDVEDFEATIRGSLFQSNISYRGSYMTTESTMFQPAHVDYDYDVLQTYGKKLYLSFFPLTHEGAFLQLWRDAIVGVKLEAETGGDVDRYNDSVCIDDVVEGTVVFIPYGKMLIVPSDTIHGGGFRRGSGGNLRFHLYIALDGDETEVGGKGTTLLDHPMNKYTERHDKRRELCERYVDSNGLDHLVGNFFDD